jgi:cytochrome c
MKSVVKMMAIVGTVCFSLASCGSKQEAKQQTEDDGYGAYDIAEPKKASPETLIAEGKKLVEGSDCNTCHHVTNKIIGPSHTEIATKYEFNQENVSLLAGKIINGGSGVWGQIPMTAHEGLSKTDAEKMAIYVLSLDGEKPNL